MLVVPKYRDKIKLLNEGLLTIREALTREVVSRHVLENVVTIVGRDLARSIILQSHAFKMGLIEGTPTPTVSENDTMASHVGWTENVDYSEVVRQDWGQSAGASTGEITNLNNEPVFTMTADSDIGGIFLGTDDTKGGTSGTLFSMPLALSLAQPLNGQFLEPTYAITYA